MQAPREVSMELDRLIRQGRRLAARTRATLARRSNVVLGEGVRFGAGVRCHAVSGARITIGDGVEVGAGTTLSAEAPGAHLEVGRDVFISGGCTIAARTSVSIGGGSMIAELVSIRDHDHDPAYPPRSGKVICAPVRVGERAWIGAKATIVRGGTVGDDSVVGAHGLVNRPIPARSLAAGVPATVKRQIDRDIGST